MMTVGLSNTEKKKQRQMNILSTIDFLGFASRSHIQAIHSLGDTRNANRVLRDMHEYLNHFRGDENIYYLNQKGRDMIGSSKEMKRNQQTEHYLMHNDIYIYLGCPSDWKVESPTSFKANVNLGGGVISSKEITLIPDGKCTITGLRHYIEVDNARVMKENQKKIESYSLLKRVSDFKLIFYTSSDIRRKKLVEWCNVKNINYEVLTKSDIV
ncbi:hypothetical protein FZW96_12155 [Bacillus sp. BGMRC 2118]|nr:hypothetical protein FZW96_12155 [Bacillus sp. BGMRC 2118]